ncbi:hypothetical protein ACFQ5J_12955 [Lacticaseibacillus baoqingensis]|uniref:IpaB/EvcA family protein n=1 Tax=Lacticaseibacillus baoqingensis TaxID=2486013 RepID=A0ABW4ECE8_9LACO|nr:hypothetical protein [Lacticaseibacillus baoqingensis]
MYTITDPQLKALFDQVQSGYTMPITIQVSGEASGQLLHSQSREVLQPDGTLVIEITDTTDVAYTLSHELLHMLYAASGYPQLQYHLLTGTPELDRQHYATATALSSAALHLLVAQWQRENGFLGADQSAQLQAGFAAVLTPEPQAGDQLLIYRSLSLFDHMTLFAAGGDATQRAQWQQRFPRAYPLAAALYATLTTKPNDSPFAYRRAVVNLFGRFNALIAAVGYAPLNNAEFATVPPVLSKRQLRLALNQVFELKHSAYRDQATKQLAYVALGKGDGQNAFVLPLKETTPEAFQQLYQEPLGAVLDQYHIDYTVRA